MKTDEGTENEETTERRMRIRHNTVYERNA